MRATHGCQSFHRFTHNLSLFYLCLSSIIKMRLKERENEVMARHKSVYDTANDTIND